MADRNTPRKRHDVPVRSRPKAAPSRGRRNGAAGEVQGSLDGPLYKHAGVYDIFFGHALRSGRKLALELLELETGDRVLEVGVGTGLSLRHYPRDVTVTAIDVSPQMLKEAAARLRKQRRANVSLLEMDAMQLDFPDGAFDKVMASHVLSAVPDPRLAFAEIKRVCAAGGVITISNRFHSDVPVVRAAERAMSPLTRKIGFILDLPMTLFTQDPALQVDEIRRVGGPAPWRVLRLVKLPVATA